MAQMQLPGFGGGRTVKKRRIPGAQQMQLPGFEDAGGPAVRPSHSVPKRRAMGGTTAGSARVSGQRFLPGFNPANAPGSGRDIKRLQMTPKRIAGIDAARARSAALKSAASQAEPNPNVVTKGMRLRPRTLMGIGLGMGVAAGVAMNRRGEGASSGRQSMYKY